MFSDVTAKKANDLLVLFAMVMFIGAIVFVMYWGLRKLHGHFNNDISHKVAALEKRVAQLEGKSNGDVARPLSEDTGPQMQYQGNSHN